MGRLMEMGALPVHNNDRPLEDHWKSAKQIAGEWGRARLAADAAAAEVAGAVKEWLDAKRAHQCDYQGFDAAIGGRDIAVASFLWGFAGEDYAALMVEVERRQRARGWRYAGRWVGPEERVGV
jgi:hypothetical protein